MKKNENLAVIYYSHRDIPTIGAACRRWINDAAEFAGVQVCAVTPYAVPDQPDWLHLQQDKTDENGHLDGYRRLLTACERLQAPAVAVVEHDVAYPLEYFAEAFKAAEKRLAAADFLYNRNVVRMNGNGFFVQRNHHAGTLVTSNLVACGISLRAELQARIKHLEAGGRIVWGEPGRYWPEFERRTVVEVWQSSQPSIDIRHGGNFTGDRAAKDGRYLPRAGRWEAATLAEAVGLKLN